MTTYRAHHNHGDFFTMAKEAINDESLSFRAKGILAYIISHADNWQVQLTDLVKHGSEGYGAIRTALNELESAGYIVRKRYRSKGGKFEWVHEVYETAVQESKRSDPEKRKTGPRDKESQPVDENPQVVEPQVDNPQVETCQILSSNDVSNNECDGKSKNDLPHAQNSRPQQAALSPEFDLSLGCDGFDALLKEKIAQNITASTGRNARGPRKFQTVQQRDVWRSAIATIEAANNGTSAAVVEAFVNKALSAGRRDLGGIINYVAKCAENGGRLYGQKRDEHPGMRVRLP